jgi:hypothetical protein
MGATSLTLGLRMQRDKLLKLFQLPSGIFCHVTTAHSLVSQASHRQRCATSPKRSSHTPLARTGPFMWTTCTASSFFVKPRMFTPRSIALDARAPPGRRKSLTHGPKSSTTDSTTRARWMHR